MGVRKTAAALKAVATATTAAAAAAAATAATAATATAECVMQAARLSALILL